NPPVSPEFSMGPPRAWISILLADPKPLFIEAIKAALNEQEDFRVVAEARDGFEAVALARRTRPDIAILDADLPMCDGLEATTLITDQVPGCRVILLSAENEGRTLLAALQAGASGFFGKDSALDELIRAIPLVDSGSVFVPPAMLGDLLDRLLRQQREEDEALGAGAQLTRREKAVLAL